MIFTEFRFIFFFLAVFAVHWALRNNRTRKVWLLLCSYVFYGAWDWRFLILIITSTLVDYFAGLGMARSTDAGSRRRWLLVSLVTNLGLLGVFKYFGFFVSSGVDLLHALGIPVHEPTFAIILPVGISFYTFQTMSYAIDIHAGRLEPTRDKLDLALFVGFFPQLVAGPIVRARTFLPQLNTARVFGRVDVRAALMLFLIGYIKKAVVSDGVAPQVDAYFAAPEAFSSASGWLAILLYSVQAYCDFSGYSDMAIGAAALLGYNLCENFRFPYFSTTISDFWRRWHISLSSWLTDYLYIPMGGSRGSLPFVWRNLMLTWLLCGLWHGAAWPYVLWGGLNGLGLVVHRSWKTWVRDRIRVPVFVGWVLTLWWWCITLACFRSVDLPMSWTVCRSLVFWSGDGTGQLGDRLVWVVLALFVVHAIAYRGVFSHWWQRVPRWSFALFYGAATALVLASLDPQAAPFMYFQF